MCDKMSGMNKIAKSSREAGKILPHWIQIFVQQHSHVWLSAHTQHELTLNFENVIT